MFSLPTLTHSLLRGVPPVSYHASEQVQISFTSWTKGASQDWGGHHGGDWGPSATTDIGVIISEWGLPPLAVSVVVVVVVSGEWGPLTAATYPHATAFYLHKSLVFFALQCLFWFFLFHDPSLWDGNPASLPILPPPYPNGACIGTGRDRGGRGSGSWRLLASYVNGALAGLELLCR